MIECQSPHTVPDRTISSDLNEPQNSVEHLGIFEKRVFAITSRILRIPIEHLDRIYSSESRLYFGCISSVGILDISKVIAKTSFFKNRSMRNSGSRRARMNF